MASTDQPSSAQHSEKEDNHDAGHADIEPNSDVTAGGDGLSEPGKGSVGRSRDASPASQSSASGLSSSKGSTQSPVPGGSSTSTPPLSMPHPKRFSHVNINKKFLEKTSSVSTPTHTLSASPTPKMTSLSQKSVPQTTGAHSRLITAKLTATPQPSTTGWSRPSSAVPSNVPTPLPVTSSKSSSSATSSSVAPLPPPVGKVIQPQPRSNQDVHLVRKESGMKPAWGNTKGGGAFDALDKVHADFPTAAEVAQGRILKATEKASLADAANAHKQAVISELMAEEDTFRGVHLNPNAHHWDEMEEDDDNFLGGVIEFGDGRQYKVQSNDPTRQSSPPNNASKSLGAVDSASTAPREVVDPPVSKDERFEDDFDRSWPRSRPGFHQAPGPSRDERSVGSATSPSSTSVHSPQESSSRVLFNERSNRLEPYSHQRHGASGAPIPFNRRTTRSDYSISPTEARRDAPPHTHPQILQKGPSGGSQPMESPTFSRAPGDRSPVSPHDRFHSRDRQSMPMRRDHPPWQSNNLQDPNRPGAFGDSLSGRSPRDDTFDHRARRSSTMEHSSGPGGDNRRQLPPHLSVPGPGAKQVPHIRTDHDLPPPPLAAPPSIPPPHAEPSAPSASSQAAESPVAPSSALPTTDVEDVRKAAMHSAAERARLRRQQEEEEREKEKERAHRKAAEIEERMKAAEQAKALKREKAEKEKQETEAQVLGIIEQAVSSVSESEKMERSDATSQHIRPVFGRAPSSRGTARPPAPRRLSLIATASTASEVDTWRRKNPPIVPSTPVERPAEEPASQAPPILATPLAHANLEVKEGEDVAVVDFADMGKLVGSDATSQQTGAPPPRARASDFFDDDTPPPSRPPPPPSKADEGPWRRRSSFAQGHGLPEKPEEPLVSGSHEAKAAAPIPLPELSRPMHVVAPPVASQPSPLEEHRRRISGSYPNGINKPVPGPHYREAPMSTLNDTMARIKGALAVMHHDVEVPKEDPKPQKWLPPALRPKTAEDCAHPTEVFDVTAGEPPKSPKRAWNTFTVKIARDTRPLQPPPKVELVWPRGQRYLRLDVCSWHPPNEAFARRDISVTDYLHGGPRYSKGKPKYFVVLPKTGSTRRPRADAPPASPIVNLPTTPPRNESTSENTAPTWRKPLASPTPSWRPSVQDPVEEVGLNTVSRSPPPEAPSTKPAVPVSSATAPAANPSAKPALATASDVAFYRTARLDSAAEPMKFVVSSELASESKLGLIGAEVAARATLSVAAPVKAIPADSRTETGHTTGLERTNGITSSPQSQSLLWPKSPQAFKEPASRAPDPEHLKAIWEQTPEKAQVQPVNSLKSIADDFTGVPLQDVKPADGQTPPPSGSGPWTRMSAYDVTRGFQQVPTPSSSSMQRPVALPPSHANGNAPRNPTFTFSPPPMAQPQPQPNPSMRPAYPYSPMMSTPSPGMMYTHPSPVPRPMVVNGGSPGYGQPVWMPAMAGPPQPGGMMRSPYPPQLVPYPSPGNAVPMYPSPMSNMQNPSQQNGVQGRQQGMPMVSPVMQPALPQMYAGSPVLVHAHPAMQPGQAYPVPGQPNRGPMRPYEQNPSAPHMHSPMRPPLQNGYNPIPSSYPRPPW